MTIRKKDLLLLKQKIISHRGVYLESNNQYYTNESIDWILEEIDKIIEGRKNKN